MQGGTFYRKIPHFLLGGTAKSHITKIHIVSTKPSLHHPTHSGFAVTIEQRLLHDLEVVGVTHWSTGSCHNLVPFLTRVYCLTLKETSQPLFSIKNNLFTKFFNAFRFGTTYHVVIRRLLSSQRGRWFQK